MARQRTLAVAAAEAMKSLEGPATVAEVHAEIVRRGLFEFGAKDPIAVVGSAIRRRTVGSKGLKGDAIFVALGKGRYELVT